MPPVQLRFLDIALNYGQGVATFLIFGVGDDLVQPLYNCVARVYRGVRRILYGAEHLPGLQAELTGNGK